MDMIHSCGIMWMASVSRSTLEARDSCTASVAIMTEGSRVFMRERRGTSFSVSVCWKGSRC
jgi:hypothetical protein